MRAILSWLAEPANLALLGTVLYGVLSTAIAVLQRLGLIRAADEAETLRSTVVATVRGVEAVKRTMDAGAADAVSAVMRAESDAAGVEHALAPIVRAVQAGAPVPTTTPAAPPPSPGGAP